MDYSEIPVEISTLNGRQSALARCIRDIEENISRTERPGVTTKYVSQVQSEGYTLKINAAEFKDLLSNQYEENDKRLNNLREQDVILKKVAAGLLK